MTETTGPTPDQGPGTASSTRQPSTKPWTDYWLMRGRIPYPFKTPDGKQATAVIPSADPAGKSVTISVSADGKTLLERDLHAGDTCNINGRTWRAVEVNAASDDSGSIVFEAVK